VGYIEKADDVPRLDRLDPYLLANTVLNAFVGRGPRDSAANALAKTCVRIVVQAVDEYEAGRLSLIDFCQPSKADFRITPILRAASHFESCLSTTRRAIGFAEAVVKGAPSLASRPLTVLEPPTVERLRMIRNVIQHMDEKIILGKIPDGEAVTLVPTPTHLSLGGVSISYRELSTWLTELRGVARELATYAE
jgi:hypothetical protein